MRKIISFLILVIFFISSNSTYVYAINDNKKILLNKIERIKVKQKANEKKYAEVLGKVDTIIENYQGKIDEKGELYQKRNKKKIRENLKKVKQKKLEVIGIANQRLKEKLNESIQSENLGSNIEIEPNYLFELQENKISDDTYYNNQWGLKNILGEYSNNSLLFSGEKITVAVIDTGVDFSNIELSESKWSNQTCYDENNELIPGGCLDGGYDFVDNDTNPFPSDNYTHGNSVAGIIAAKTNNNTGIASIANDIVEIMSLRTCCGDSNYFGAENIARAIYFAVNNDAQIINASFGGPTYSKVIEDALIYARNNGVLVIAAAGNYGSNNDTNPLYPANYDLDNIISVAATTNEDTLAYFSNYGSNSIDLAAPGENVYSITTGNNIQTVNGTSFSTPFITSIAARYLSQNTNFTYADVIDRIYSTSQVNTKLNGNIKNNLQLKLDPNSLVDPVININNPVDPIEENPDPSTPDTNPINNSHNELDEQYSKIMNQIALFRQGKISQNNIEKYLSFQELTSLEDTLQEYIYTETQYLEDRSDISSEKKLKYLELLNSQLELVKSFNTQLNNQNQIQSFSTLTQQEQQSQISQILGNLGIQPVQKVEPKILDDMSSFTFGENNKQLKKISDIKAIETNSNTPIESPVIQGIIPQETSTVNTSDLSGNNEIIIDESIQNLAEELGNNPVNIFNYVRNNIAYEAYYGSKKSSISCLQDKLCNDIDQTNLTLALLRASGIPAKYQTSRILVSKENISKLLGVPDIKMALYALRTADIPAERVNTGQANFSQTTDFESLDMSDDEYLVIEWTRAQALVKYNHLGGNYNNDFYLDSSLSQSELETKISQENNLEWVSIDPTFVFHDVINNSQDVRIKNISERKDLLQASNINISDFFTDYLKNINNTNVSEILKQDIVSQISELNNLSGEQLENTYNTYLYSKKPKVLEFDTLPLSQAYTGVEVTRDGVVISEKLFSQLEENQKQYLEISLKRQSNDEVVFKNKYSIDEVNNTPITLDYIGATDADRQTIIDKGSLHLTPADLVDLYVSVDTQAQAIETLTTPQTVKIGEGLIMTFTYSVGGEVINTSSKYALGGNSEGVYMSFGPIPEDTMDSDSKVLLAGNWAIAKRYLERITQYNKSLEQIVGSVNDLHYTRAVVTQNRILNPIGGTATTLDFKGLSLDAHTFVKDYTLSNYQTHRSRSTDMRKLFGIYASEQEGQIFDDITGLTGISTTRGLQYAYNSPGYTVYEIDSSNKSQIELLGFSENTKQSMRDYVDEGRTIITPDSMVSNQNWQGIFYIAIAQNGEGMYAIGENVVGNGGFTVTELGTKFLVPQYQDLIIDDTVIEDYFTEDYEIIDWLVGGVSNTYAGLINTYYDNGIILTNSQELSLKRQNGESSVIDNILEIVLNSGKVKVIESQGNNQAFYYTESNGRTTLCNISSQKIFDVFNTNKYRNDDGYNKFGFPCSYNIYEQKSLDGGYKHHFIQLSKGAKFRKNNGGNGNYNYWVNHAYIEDKFQNKIQYIGGIYPNVLIGTFSLDGYELFENGSSSGEGSTINHNTEIQQKNTTIFNPSTKEIYLIDGDYFNKYNGKLYNYRHYNKLELADKLLGFPLSNKKTISSGKEVQEFENGSIYHYTNEKLFSDESFVVYGKWYSSVKNKINEYGLPTSNIFYNTLETLTENLGWYSQTFENKICAAGFGNTDDVQCYDDYFAGELSLGINYFVENLAYLPGYFGNLLSDSTNTQETFTLLRNNVAERQKSDFSGAEWIGYIGLEIGVGLGEALIEKIFVKATQKLTLESVKQTSKNIAHDLFIALENKDIIYQPQFADNFNKEFDKRLLDVTPQTKQDVYNIGIDAGFEAYKKSGGKTSILSKFKNIHWSPKLRQHVIYGEVYKRKAKGLHSIIGVNNNAKLVGEKINVGPEGSGFYESNIQIRISESHPWRDKNEPSTFFPDNWSEEKILDKISEAFDNMQNLGIVNGRTIYGGKTKEGYTLQFFFDDDWNISAVYPNFQTDFINKFTINGN